ncbi:MAG: BMP family ABC transporter substrate-binding protein, partial [Clostridia bacterium]|nr:BMP family ABC transporter substrate-binding protein [Clostridia bacterium]
EEIKEEDFKVGVIVGTDTGLESDIKNTLKKLGLNSDLVTVKSDISADGVAVAANELVMAGCKFIVAGDSSFEDQMVKSAKGNKGVQFVTIGGLRAKTELVGNYHSAYTNVYEGRYISGVAAGLKLKEIAGDSPKLGFVAKFNDAEAISAFTAFYLGAKSVCENATLDVKFTNAAYNTELETAAAKALIDGGCKILSYNTDSSAVADTCAANGAFTVLYGQDVANYSTSAIVSLNVSYESYFEFAFTNMLNATAVPSDFCALGDEGAYILSDVNANVAAKGTSLYITNARAKLLNNKLSVFDIKTFTVGGNELSTYLADVVYDVENIGDSEAVANGCFNESAMRSAPYFDIIIDGVNIK